MCGLADVHSVGVVHSRHAPRRTCQASGASTHETALHYLVGCGDVEAVGWAVRRGWALGAVVDENADFFSLAEHDIVELTAFAIDLDATDEKCRIYLDEPRSTTTAMDTLIQNAINWPGHDRSVEMVNILLNTTIPTAGLLWKARFNTRIARELIRLGAPCTNPDHVPDDWRKYMGNSPFTMLAHAFYEACWEHRPYFKIEAAEVISGFIDALLDAGERGDNGENSPYSWEIMFECSCANTCLESRLNRALC